MKKVIALAVVLTVSAAAFVACNSDENEFVETSQKQLLLSGWYKQNNNMDSLEIVTESLLRTGLSIPEAKANVPYDLLQAINSTSVTFSNKMNAITYMSYSEAFMDCVAGSDDWELYRHFFIDRARR